MEWPARRQRRRDEDPSRLVEATEAFLLGRFLEVTASSGSGTPSWAQINWIAHAEPDDIREAPRRTAPTAAPVPIGSWAWAVGVLTQELMALTAAEPDAVRELQRGCLVPLELTMMLPSFWNVMPAEVLTLAVTRLRAHPRSRPDGSMRVSPPDGTG